MRDRRVVDHSPVDEKAITPRDWRQQPRDRGGGEDRIERRPLRQADLIAAEEVVRDEVQRHPGVLQTWDLQVPGHQAPQRLARHEVVAAASQRPDDRGHVQRQDILPAQAAPHVRELPGGLCRLRARRHEGSVQRSGRRRDESVRDDPTLIEPVQHAGLHRAQARPAGQHERSPGRAAPALTRRLELDHLMAVHEASVAPDGVSARRINCVIATPGPRREPSRILHSV